MTAEKQTPIERTDHTPHLYEAAFGRIVNQPNVETIVDIAAGDSRYAVEKAAQTGKRIIRVDSDYARIEPHGDDWLPDDARHLSLEDAVSDATISAFLMQHLSTADQQKVIAEMLRVTKPFDGKGQGVIGLFPIYNPRRVQEALDAAGLDDQAFVMEDVDMFDRGMIAERKLTKPTLWIPNHGTPDEQAELILVVTESGGLTRRKTMLDLARKARMRAAGDSRITLS